MVVAAVDYNNISIATRHQRQDERQLNNECCVHAHFVLARTLPAFCFAGARSDELAKTERANDAATAKANATSLAERESTRSSIRYFVRAVGVSRQRSAHVQQHRAVCWKAGARPSAAAAVVVLDGDAICTRQRHPPLPELDSRRTRTTAKQLY